MCYLENLELNKAIKDLKNIVPIHTVQASGSISSKPKKEKNPKDE